MCLNMSKDYSYQAVSHEYLRNGRGKQNVRIQCFVAVILDQQLPVPLAKIPESFKNSHACLMNILSHYNG